MCIQGASPSLSPYLVLGFRLDAYLAAHATSCGCRLVVGEVSNHRIWSIVSIVEHRRLVILEEVSIERCNPAPLSLEHCLC